MLICLIILHYYILITINFIMLMIFSQSRTGTHTSSSGNPNLNNNKQNVKSTPRSSLFKNMYSGLYYSTKCNSCGK